MTRNSFVLIYRSDPMVKLPSKNPPSSNLQRIILKDGISDDPYFERTYGEPTFVDPEFYFLFIRAGITVGLLAAIVNGLFQLMTNNVLFPWSDILIGAIIVIGLIIMVHFVKLENKIIIGPDLLIITDTIAGEIQLVDENGWEWTYLKLSPDGIMQWIGTQKSPLASIPLANFGFDALELKQMFAAILQSFPLFAERGVSKLKIDGNIIDFEIVE